MSNQGDTTGGWQLEDSGPRAYERYLVPEIFAPWADHLVEHANLQPGDSVLDVGCGTGIVARRAALQVGSDGTVVGVDVNEGMLAVARSTSADLPGIEWRQGDATDLPFVEGAFDVVFCQQVLQFVPAPGAALREMYRVLTPDGRLAMGVLRSLAFNHTYAVLADTLAAHVGDDAAQMMRSPFPEWDDSDLRALIQDAGFQDVTITNHISSVRYPSTEEFLRREAASSPLAGPLGSVSSDVRTALLADLGEALEPYTDDHGVVFPIETYVAVARR